MRSRLADYELVEPFGSGATVSGRWLARPPERLGDVGPRVVVVELPDPGPERWPEVCARLSSVACVSEPHLGRLLEAGRTAEDGGSEWVAWVVHDGADAHPLPAADSRAVQAIVEAARAAHALHEAGWAHGTIGPDTVLAGERGTWLEPPLGTACGGPGAALSAPGRAVGPAALDPLDPMTVWGEGPSRAGDIWSLGATAHALVTGRLIHPDLPGDAPVTAVQRVLMEEPRFSDRLEGDLLDVLHSCLAPDPGDRPKTAADLADRLEGLAAAR